MHKFLTQLIFIIIFGADVYSGAAQPIFDPVVLSAEEIEKFDRKYEELLERNSSEGSLFMEKGWPRTDLIWQTSIIPVCWENASDGDIWFKSVVQQAVIDTWEAHSKVKFSEVWEDCVYGNRGIRVQIADEGPRTKGLGKSLDGKIGGMVLNSTYVDWMPSCQSRLVFCSYVVAVHEFGHAIGFAHDHNRPDTPAHCDAPRAGSIGSPETLHWTPWDADSVMNYCNPDWSNGGKLSKFDIYQVQRMYNSL